MFESFRKMLKLRSYLLWNRQKQEWEKYCHNELFKDQPLIFYDIKQAKEAASQLASATNNEIQVYSLVGYAKIDKSFMAPFKSC